MSPIAAPRTQAPAPAPSHVPAAALSLALVGFLLLVLPGRSAPAQETRLVGGFHGYGWGDPGREIAEIDLDLPPDRRAAGLAAYARTVYLLGRPTRTYFYLDSAALRLRAGRYLMDADPGSCVADLTTLRLMIAGSWSGLESEVRVVEEAAPGDRSRGAEDVGAASPDPPTSCRAFLSGPPRRVQAIFRNPATGEAEVTAELFRRDSLPRILACYHLPEDCRWPEGVEVEKGPALGAPARRDTSLRTRRRRRTPRSPPASPAPPGR